MMPNRSIVLVASTLFLVFLILLPALVLGAVTNTTAMTWIIASNKSHTISYGGACSASNFYFIETNGEDADSDGNSAKVLPYDASNGGSVCQSAAVASITVTNNGNTSINIDANFQTGLSGNDQNVGIKVWMGTGSGCGSNGLGGWQLNCSVQSTTNPVTATTCRDFNMSNFTTTARLVSSLAKTDTNQLCFAGEINGKDTRVGAGTISRNFDTNAS